MSGPSATTGIPIVAELGALQPLLDTALGWIR